MLAGALALAVETSRPEDWHSPTLLGILIVFAILSESLTVEGRGVRISGSFIAIVLAMITLGPGPAMVVGLSGIAFDAVRRPPTWLNGVGNVTTYAVFPLLGGLAWQFAEPLLASSTLVGRGSAIVTLFMATNVVNFLQIAIPDALVERRKVGHYVRQILLPLLPSQLVAGVLTATVDLFYEALGLASLALAAIVALVFQHLLRTTMTSVHRAKELEQRSLQLAGMQMGLITTVLRTLSLRDKMTARHSAAVARYAREVARELGLDEAAQDTIHTAALLHDIGKVTFPDAILLSSHRLTDEQYVIVKRHPEQGAELVRHIDGYGEVADIILAHHERIDGHGYPLGIAGESIPIGSRIIAVCDTYDVMTARDSYRDPVSPAEAVAELRRVSGTQLDGELVELFVRLLERKGVAFHHGDDADFESELDLERRIRKHAEPRKQPISV